MGYLLLPIYNRRREIVCFAAVDADDYSKLACYRWSVARTGHILRQWRGGRVFLHNAIMSPPTGMEVDHIDRNPRNNRRSNLRICTHAENHQNKGASPNKRSRFRGVAFDRQRGKWVAKHKLNGRTHNLGRFQTEEEAAKVAARFRAKHMPFSVEGRR